MPKATLSPRQYNANKRHARLFLTAFASLGMLSLSSFSAHASTLISSKEYLEYELPTSIQQRCYEKENCPEIDIEYIKTNHNWINNIVNARINNIVINSQPTEAAFNKADSKTAATTALDNFVSSQYIDLPDDVPWGYSLMVKPDYLGHVERFETFEINAYVFTGGAHGMPFNEYFIFDSQTKKQVKLADMLLKNQKPRFEALAHKAYQAWIKTLDEDVESYEQSWPFTLSDNVTLTDKGIDIGYQHYEIAPYAYGMPVLSIPYSQLQGIIKPAYLIK